jgi:hypothetical protein
MASLISSTSWGGGMAGGPLRCSVCGRRDAAVEHLVRARGVHICDRCVAQASEALAAVEPGQKVVRIRPASAHVGDRETAEAAVEEAFETVFNGRVPIEERCHAIENGTPEPPTNPGRLSCGLRVSRQLFWGMIWGRHQPRIREDVTPVR